MTRQHSHHHMRETSLKAYAELKPELGPRQNEVFNAIGDYPGSTDAELTIILGYKDPNAVRPRRFELVEQGLVVEGLKRKCVYSGRKALTWYQSSDTTARDSE